MYCCVFWCEFIDLVGVFWLLLCDPCHSLHNTKYWVITFTPKLDLEGFVWSHQSIRERQFAPQGQQQASWMFFFQNILTNPIISHMYFFMTSRFRTLFRILILPTSDYSQTPPYGHPFKTDTGLLLRTAQFALSLEKESPYIFCKFKPLNTDTPLMRTLSLAPSISVLTGIQNDCCNKYILKM